MKKRKPKKRGAATTTAFGNAIDRERKIIDAIDTTIRHASKRRK